MDIVQLGQLALERANSSRMAVEVMGELSETWGYSDAAESLLVIDPKEAFIFQIMPDDTGIPWTDVVFKGLNIKGIYGREMYETWYKMVMMIQSGLPIERVITHRFHYTEFQKGFDIMRSGQSGKVILDWKD